MGEPAKEELVRYLTNDEIDVGTGGERRKLSSFRRAQFIRDNVQRLPARGLDT